MILIYIGQANWSLHIRGTNSLTIGIHTLFVLLCMDAANHYMTPSPRTFPECSLRGLQYFGDPVRRVEKQMMSKNVQQYYTLKCPIRDLLPNVFFPEILTFAPCWIFLAVRRYREIFLLVSHYLCYIKQMDNNFEYSPCFCLSSNNQKLFFHETLACPAHSSINEIIVYIDYIKLVELSSYKVKPTYKSLVIENP